MSDYEIGIDKYFIALDELEKVRMKIDYYYVYHYSTAGYKDKGRQQRLEAIEKTISELEKQLK